MSVLSRTILYAGFFAVFLSCVIALITMFEGQNVATYISNMKNGSHNPYREFNEMINSYFFTIFKLQGLASFNVSKFGDENGYYVNCYMRDLVMGTAVYWITALVWHFAIYVVFRHKFFTSKQRELPTWETIFDQIQMAQSSLFVYAGLPVLSEFLIESKLTKVYFYLDEVGGWKNYVLYLILYVAFVDVGVYWVHRTLHENKFLYKYVHGLHHKYNKSSTLTPWASIAFNPIDGILQASPYVVFLFFIPVHYFTHVSLLFFTGVWATNIHDSMWGDTEPIMGSKYHTMHHTHYHYNFGQFFTYADQIFGTFKCPAKSKFD